MRYISTRALSGSYVSSAEAIRNGLAPDGGLYMPETIPALSRDDLAALLPLSYPERAAKILSLYLTDYTYDELLEDATAAYGSDRFPGGAAPLRKIDDGITSLELWHGPTCAFKDMALQIMPRLLVRAMKKGGVDRTALILVATSGDTGKAALEGYRDIPGVKIQVFYPTDGVSRVQKLQMTTQEGDNLSVVGIRGNFDDAQNGVKRIFADPVMQKDLADKGMFLSSANSINWGRLAPQIAYYVSAYCDMVNAREVTMGDEIDVCVPSGNFGNIFAAYLARRMGLPFNRLVCASNQNNVLTDFLDTGVYDRRRAFYTTMSPSMDILISSNLERLLYVVSGSEATASCMKNLADAGTYTVSPRVRDEIRAVFSGYCCDEDATADALARAYRDASYLIDPHTAVGYGACLQYRKRERGGRKILLASTASPYKFARDVLSSLVGNTPADDLACLDALAALTGCAVPAPLSDLAARKVRFTDTIGPEEMPRAVRAFAGA